MTEDKEKSISWPQAFRDVFEFVCVVLVVLIIAKCQSGTL